MTGDDFNLYPKKIDGHVRALKVGKSHAVFFGGNNAVEIPVQAAIDKIDDLLLCVAVMICVTPHDFDVRPKAAQPIFKTFGDSYSTHGSYILPLQVIQRFTLPRQHVFKIERPVPTLDDLRSAVVLSDALNQFLVAAAVALGNKNVTGPPKISGRFTQRSSRKHVLISEGRIAIDQYDIEPMA